MGFLLFRLFKIFGLGFFGLGFVGPDYALAKFVPRLSIHCEFQPGANTLRISYTLLGLGAVRDCV